MSILGGLADEFEELLEFGRDDDLGATVTLLAHGRIVGHQGVVLTTSASGQPFGVNAIIVLQRLYHR